MFKKLTAVLLPLLLTFFSATAGEGDEPSTISKIEESTAIQGVPFGLTIKIMPALYWGCLGIQAEYPINPNFSLALMLTGEKSDSKGYAIKPEDYQNAGYAIDLIGKYYFGGKAPDGLYGLVDLSYNTMLFYDGNTRPYTLHNRWKEFEDFRVPNSINSPKAYNFGVGFGYELVIIPQHIMADVSFVSSLNFDDSNSMFLQLYIVPTLGFKF